MGPLFPGHHYSPERWLRRLDRAAGRLNPILTMVAIGLVVLNLTSLVLLARHIPVVRLAADGSACPASAVGDIGPALPGAAIGIPPTSR